MFDLFFVLISCLFFTQSFGIQQVQYINGAYNGLTIAIHSKVAENDFILPSLQELLTKSSKFLHDASEKLFQFDTIDIIIPKSWKNNPNYKAISGSYFGKAHVRLGLTDEAYGDLPYTFQPRQCGESGEYIRLSDVYIKELNGNSIKRFGDPSKHFIHEWAQYRYGLFEENGITGDPKYPSFYLVKGKDNETFFSPTACTHRIFGYARYADGSKCQVFTGAKVDPKCQFVVDTRESTSKASIMFLPHLQSTIKFCESKSVDPLILHNKMAPSKHNLMCDYLSTWDVIKMHDDYKNKVTKEFKPPVFRIFREDDAISSRFVLAMDVTGSMGSSNRMGLLTQACTRFVKDLIPNGMDLGLVTFSFGAKNLSQMVKVDDQTRKDLTKLIPTTCGGGGSPQYDIDKGLQASFDILKANNGRTLGATVILITDGEDSSDYPKVADQLTAAGIKIDVIAVGNGDDPRLEGIAKKSGGIVFYLKDGDTSSNRVFETALKRSVKELEDLELQSVTIKNGEAVEIKSLSSDPEAAEVEFSIDKELGKNTKFIVHSEEIARLSVIFNSPDGKSFTDKDYKKDAALKNIQLDIPVAAPGKWKAIFTQSSPGNSIMASLTVSSEPKDPNNQPIRLTTYFGKLNIVYPAKALIYAQVTKGSNAVINAKVISTIIRPNTAAVEVELFDDGKGDDVAANDGIYTASFTQFTANGRYSVNARVFSNEKTKMRINDILDPDYFLSRHQRTLPINLVSILAGEKAKNAFTIDDFESTNEPLEEKKFKTADIESFTRESTAGAFKLDNYDASVKILPGRVTDLRIKSIDEEKHIVELEFTTPGDAGFDGNVSLIDLRANSAQEALIEKTTFESSLKIDQTMLIFGKLENVAGRSISVVKFEIPKQFFEGKTDGKTSIYFALRGVDTKKNSGDISNVESVHIGYVSVKHEPFPVFKYHVQDKLNYLKLTLGLIAEEGNQAIEDKDDDVMKKLLKDLDGLDKDLAKLKSKVSAESRRKHNDVEQKWFIEDALKQIEGLIKHSGDMRELLEDGLKYNFIHYL